MVVYELNLSLHGCSAKQNLCSILQLCWYGQDLWYTCEKKTCLQSRGIKICVTFVDCLAQILSGVKLSNTCLNVLIFEKQSIQASWRSRGRNAGTYFLSLSTKWMFRYAKRLQVFLNIFFTNKSRVFTCLYFLPYITCNFYSYIEVIPFIVFQ